MLRGEISRILPTICTCITSNWFPSLPTEYMLPSLGLGRNLYLQYLKQYKAALEISSFLTHN